MSVIQLGSGGKVLLGPDGTVATDPACCCGGNCECYPLTIDATGTFSSTLIDGYAVDGCIFTITDGVITFSGGLFDAKEYTYTGTETCTDVCNIECFHCPATTGFTGTDTLEFDLLCDTGEGWDDPEGAKGWWVKIFFEAHSSVCFGSQYRTDFADENLFYPGYYKFLSTISGANGTFTIPLEIGLLANLTGSASIDITLAGCDCAQLKCEQISSSFEGCGYTGFTTGGLYRTFSGNLSWSASCPGTSAGSPCTEAGCDETETFTYESHMELMDSVCTEVLDLSDDVTTKCGSTFTTHPGVFVTQELDCAISPCNGFCPGWLSYTDMVITNTSKSVTVGPAAGGPSHCDGGDATGSGSSSITLGDEITADDLVEGAVETLPDYDDVFDDFCISSRFVSPDVTSADITRCQYKFTLNSPLPFPCVANWIVRTWDADDNCVGDEVMTTTIAPGETESEVFELTEPDADGFKEIVYPTDFGAGCV